MVLVSEWEKTWEIRRLRPHSASALTPAIRKALLYIYLYGTGTRPSGWHKCA